jgi:hypothetical protein
VGEQAAVDRRGPVGTGTLWFAGASLVLSFCLLMLNGVGVGVGATGVHASRSDGVSAHKRVAVVSTNSQANSNYSNYSNYWGTDDVPPRPKPHESAPPAATPAAPAPAIQVSTPPPTPAPPPPPPPAPPAALPGRGAATTYGCAAALTYLAAYSAPGFTFQCPGYALGHQAMTCIDEAGVCDNEHLIAIADPCPAAYMNEASNSWVLTGASDSPIDPYGACS